MLGWFLMTHLQSHVRVVLYQDGLSSDWSLVMMVLQFHKDGLPLSLMQVVSHEEVCHQGGLSRWSLIRAVSHQDSLLSQSQSGL